MLYFAYGSNMDWQQMQERCPSARFVSVARLPNHKLAFTRKSVRRGCGVADAVPEHGRELWGVVYEIDDPDRHSLDAAEGYRAGRKKNAYWRRERPVLLNGDGRRPMNTAVYFADPQPRPPLPNAHYKELIISGARHWHLPVAYIRALQQIEVDS